MRDKTRKTSWGQVTGGLERHAQEFEMCSVAMITPSGTSEQEYCDLISTGKTNGGNLNVKQIRLNQLIKVTKKKEERDKFKNQKGLLKEKKIRWF